MFTVYEITNILTECNVVSIDLWIHACWGSEAGMEA